MTIEGGWKPAPWNVRSVVDRQAELARLYKRMDVNRAIGKLDLAKRQQNQIRNLHRRMTRVLVSKVMGSWAGL